MKNIKRYCFLISIVLYMFFNSINIYASESDLSLEIPVSIILKGNAPGKLDEFEIVLLPVNEKMPMPKEGLNVLTVQGENTGTFAEIRFSKPGIYEYTLSQVEKETMCIYDRKIYHLKVYVVNSSNGLEMTTIIYETNENDKVSIPVFTNEYPERETDGSNHVTTGDSSNLEMNAVIIVVSFSVMIYILWINRKKKNLNKM